MSAQAERRRILESFANGPATLGAALRRFPRKMWVYKDSPDRPSIHDTICSLADAEVIEYVYCRRFIADPGVPPVEIDPHIWTGNLDYFYVDIKAAMGVIRSLRRVTYHFLQVLPQNSWTRVLDLPGHGRLSLDDWLEIRENSFPANITRMERIYTVWWENRSSVHTPGSASKHVPVESFAS
ncbi:MAG: hypothetical protein WA192_08000 [Candidatus Acidiferrales bacterium]